MSIRQNEFVKGIYELGKPYTPRDVQDYISKTGKSKFGGERLQILIRESALTLDFIMDKIGIEQETRLDNTTDIGKRIAEIAHEHDKEFRSIILNSAADKGILI